MSSFGFCVLLVLFVIDLVPSSQQQQQQLPSKLTMPITSEHEKPQAECKYPFEVTVKTKQCDDCGTNEKLASLQVYIQLVHREYEPKPNQEPKVFNGWIHELRKDKDGDEDNFDDGETDTFYICEEPPTDRVRGYSGKHLSSLGAKLFKLLIGTLPQNTIVRYPIVFFTVEQPALQESLKLKRTSRVLPDICIEYATANVGYCS